MGQFYTIMIKKENTFHELLENIADLVNAPVNKIILYRIMCQDGAQVEMGDMIYQNGTIGKKMSINTDDVPLEELNIMDRDMFNLFIKLL